MKRHLQLQPLSRQHHNGLLMALLLKKGLQKNASAAVMNDFIAKGWEEDLQEHFRMEEGFLIPALQGLPFDSALTDKLISEHQQLRELALLASGNQASYHQLAMFADFAETHIRFEERVYFPAAEAVLNEGQLQEIGTHLHEDPSNNCINYPVKFWE